MFPTMFPTIAIMTKQKLKKSFKQIKTKKIQNNRGSNLGPTYCAYHIQSDEQKS